MTQLVFLIVGFLFLTLGCSARAPSGAELGEAGDGVPRQLQARQVIVTLPPATPEVWAILAKNLSADYGLAQVGAFPLTSLGVQCVVFQVSQDRTLDQALAQLSADPRVESVQLNQSFQGLGTPSDDPYAEFQYGPRVVRADQAHRWVRGRGIRVAIVDTGVETNHPDLSDRIVQTSNFVDGGEQTFTADYHGTAVAGVIGAQLANGKGIYGVAPAAELVAIKACWHRRPATMDAWCSSWTLAKAIDFAIVERVRVLNLSLSGPPDPLLRRLITKAIDDEGITVVAAVMERGNPSLSFPSNLPGVIGVVASDPERRVRVSDSKDRSFVAAPGVKVLTTVPQGTYDFLTGSSFAAAHVSGVVALLIERYPHLTPRQIINLLVSTGRADTSNNRDAAKAPVHVDACAALQRLAPATTCH